MQTETGICIGRDRDRGGPNGHKRQKDRKKERKETTLDYKKTQL